MAKKAIERERDALREAIRLHRKTKLRELHPDGRPDDADMELWDKAAPLNAPSLDEMARVARKMNTPHPRPWWRWLYEKASG